MKVLRHLAPAVLLIALSAAKIISADQFLHVVNPIFGNVPIQCSGGYAYQFLPGATCTSQAFPAQDFDGTPGMGWRLTPNIGTDRVHGSGGVTGPNTAFEPPSFSGLPFSYAAFLQGGPKSEAAQTIFGFVAQQPYVLSFYLGSRYTSGGADGNQTVAVYIDDGLIGIFPLVSYTPFTIRHAFFEVATTGPHNLRFVGIALGDHTAFLSGVIIKAVATPDTE